MGQAETATRVEVGALIAETYEIKRLLGRGGMGTVWEAHHARLPGKRVAIKVLHPEVAKDSESLARFRREAEIASRIGHPNIVDVHDFNELEDGTPYLILEYLVGCDLEERLRRGPMTVDAAISLTRQVGSALRAAHREGVVHRDLKPQNIFLCRTTDADGNETEMAKVLDFGISKIRGSQTVKTHDSAILGTPQYMAPEQATGAHQSVDARTDVFALGAIVYEMLAGRPAFTGQTIPEVVFKVVYEDPTPLEQVAQVSPAVARAVRVALSKKQEERWGSVEELIEALSGTGLSVSGPIATAPAATDEALASTIASGAHTPVPGLGPDIGTARTIDSGQMDRETAGIATSQTMLAPSPQGATPPRRRLLIPAVIALLLLIAAGAATALVIARGSGGDDVAANAEVAADAAATPVALPDAAAVADIEDPQMIDAAARDPDDPIRVAVAVDAAPPTPKTVRARPEIADAARGHSVQPQPDAAPAETTETPSRADLREAERLIAANPHEAIRLARRAQRDGARGELPYAIRAMAHCKLLDLTAVRGALSRVTSRRLRRRVVRRCKRFGMDVK